MTENKLNNFIEDVGDIVEDAKDVVEDVGDIVEDVDEVIDAAEDVGKKTGGILSRIKQMIISIISFFKNLFRKD